MLRPARTDDTPALIDLAIATELFLPEEAAFLGGMLADFHAGRAGSDHRVQIWADDPPAQPAGVVYFGPNALGDRTWDLIWISVAPDRQGQGIGGELIRFTEAHIREAGGRMLLIETSSLPRFAATHAFYGKHGYTKVARIPDFYADGDSKVIFAKRIAD
jgi:ribosomal protein S18 acetylase RimI-like enzyme